VHSARPDAITNEISPSRYQRRLRLAITVSNGTISSPYWRKFVPARKSAPLHRTEGVTMLTAKLTRQANVDFHDRIVADDTNRFRVILAGCIGNALEWWPAQPTSRVQSQPHVFSFRAQMMGRAFDFEDEGGHYSVSFSLENRMQIEQKFLDGKMSWVTLDPVWTFADAEERQRT
jgi:hypothetical protein